MVVARIDNAVLAAHQWVLDKTQLQPTTAKNWLFNAIAVMSLVRVALSLSDGVDGWLEGLVVLLAPCAVFMCHVLRLAPASAHASLLWLRMLFLVCVLIPPLPLPDQIAGNVIELLILALLYVCLCEKPKAPRRKSASCPTGQHGDAHGTAA